jgi:undecaprenyl-phosphate 4-deoxy-4-formamido-L-arabinose transferase
VDDGSADNSAAILAEAAEKPGSCMVAVLLNRNYGQHSAVMAGLAQADGDLIITLDADLQNPPEEIPLLTAKADEGYDVVGSIRENRQDSFFRKLASRLINKFIRATTGKAMSDYGCMLRAYRRHIVDAMLECHERSTFIPILANTFAQKTVEITVRHAEREFGTSKYGIFKLINLLYDLVTCLSTTPLRLLSILGSLIAASGFLLALTIVLLRLVLGSAWAAEGVFMLFAILFIFIGAQFVGMGILGEYIGRIYTDVRARPRYFVQRVIGSAVAGRKQEKEQ